MPYSDQPWESRYGTLGDEAEAQFELHSKLGFVRAGLKRPKVRVRDLHPYERHRPDYLTSKGYVEVMGLGEDQILKLKVRKLEALHFWTLLMPVSLWVWDSFRKRYAEITLKRLDDLVTSAKIAFFPEGTAYYEIPAEGLFAEEGKAA